MCNREDVGYQPKNCKSGTDCYENKVRSQELNLDNKCFQQIIKAQL